MYEQADVLEVQIQQIEENSIAAKQALQELRHPVKISAHTMQQLASKANTQINTVFGNLSPDAGEEVVAKITVETDVLMQGR